MTPNTNAIALVPLRELTDLARLGLGMRKAQRAYFKKRRERPHASADVEYRLARDAELKFDAAVRDALNRERQTIPGMDDE